MQSFVTRGGRAAAVALVLVVCTWISAVNAQPAAELAAKGVWNAGTTYAIDDIVTARGSTWRSKRNNNLNKVPGQTGPAQPSTAAYWEIFARGFNPTGAWSNASTYHPDDLVTQSGRTYRAKLTGLNKPPTNTNYWELLAARGADGAPGAQGIQGPAGPNTGVSKGTANAPAISFAGDSNTGIYSPSDGKIALVENGQLVLHSTGTFNIGVGPRALLSNTSGVSNTALGSDALVSNTTGSNNTAIGLAALLSNNGAGNTAVGSKALRDNTASFSTAVGNSALAENTTGFFNTAIGDRALAVNITGHSNVAVGGIALNDNVAGTHNTALGVSALFKNTASENTAVGFQALFRNTTGLSNTAVGYSALGLNIGTNNVALGANAGEAATLSSNGIFIGNAGTSGDDATIRIGDLQSKTFIAGITGVSVSGGAAVEIDANGQLGVASPSSRRYKDDIQTMSSIGASLQKLRPVTFHYKKVLPNGTKPLQYGLIAEEVADVLPALALFDRDGQPDGVKYQVLPSLLLAAYQEQQITIATQAEEIVRLKARVAASEAVEDRVRRLEALLPQTKAAALEQKTGAH